MCVRTVCRSGYMAIVTMTELDAAGWRELGDDRVRRIHMQIARPGHSYGDHCTDPVLLLMRVFSSGISQPHAGPCFFSGMLLTEPISIARSARNGIGIRCITSRHVITFHMGLVFSVAAQLRPRISGYVKRNSRASPARLMALWKNIGIYRVRGRRK